MQTYKTIFRTKPLNHDKLHWKNKYDTNIERKYIFHCLTHLFLFF